MRAGIVIDCRPMIVRAALVSLICLTVQGTPADASDTKPFAPVDKRLEKLFDGGCVVLEGVTSAPDGTIYFSDITATPYCKDETGEFPAAGNIWRLDPTTKRISIFRSPSGMSNALRFDAAGNLVVAEGADFGGRRITRTNMATGRSYIVSGLYEGRPYNSPNDIAIDQTGRIYFTDPRYLGHEPLEQLIEAVYRVDGDGKVTRLPSRAGKPNGIGISPDQKTLYIVDSDNGSYRLGSATRMTISRLYAYDLRPDGSIENERVLIDWSGQAEAEIAADGMAVDVEGNLYIAVQQPGRHGVRVYSPAGKEVSYISTGNFAPQSVGFGRGADANVLYVTAQQNLFRIRLPKSGFQLAANR